MDSARLGRIVRVAGGLYRSMDTGRFLSARVLKPILEKARMSGYIGAASKGKYERSATTYMERYGLTRKEALMKVVKNMRGYKKWLADLKAGKKVPEYYEWESP